MSKILVGEFRKLNGKVKEVAEVEFEGLNIEVKNYLPIKEKMELALQIFAETMTINEDDGLLTFDDTVREIATVCFLVERYTNITLPKDKFEAYDIIKSSYLDEIVIKNVDEREIDSVNAMVDNYIRVRAEKYEQENNISNVIKNAISGLGNSLDGLDLESLKDEVAKQGQLN